jgi:hypothetical protein
MLRYTAQSMRSAYDAMQTRHDFKIEPPRMDHRLPKLRPISDLSPISESFPSWRIIRGAGQLPASLYHPAGFFLPPCDA